MNVSRIARLGSIDVCMCIHPNDGDFSTQSLFDCFGGAGDCADGYTVISAQCQDKPSLGSMLIDLLRKLLVDRRDCSGIPHIPVRRIRLGNEGLVVVNCVIVVNVVSKVFLELSQETSFNESGRAMIYSCVRLQWLDYVVREEGEIKNPKTYLPPREANRDNSQLGFLGEELGRFCRRFHRVLPVTIETQSQNGESNVKRPLRRGKSLSRHCDAEAKLNSDP